MEDKFVQTIRYKLQKRVRRLNSASVQQFPSLLKIFFQSFDNSPLLRGVRDELLARVASHDLPASVERIFKYEALLGATEETSAALGYLFLLRYSANSEEFNLLNLGWSYQRSADQEQALDIIRTNFLEPFYEYFDEHLDDQQAILYFLRRYKHRCEWFHAERLRQLAEGETQKGEKSLARDLYEYLHGQGIDFHIEPHTVSGIPDFVADQVGSDRVIADTKLFWPEKSKAKSYILSGFHQAYIYACNLNEPTAYLVIYKLCSESLNFLTPASTSLFPSFTVNNKTIFFVVVDICEYEAPASKRGTMRSYDITPEDLRLLTELHHPSGGCKSFCS